MVTKVEIGITTIVGWLTALMAMLPTIIKVFEEGGQALLIGGPEKWLAIGGIIIASITQIGRYFQAHALIKYSGTKEG